MRHLKQGRKFGRTRNPRKALLRTLLYQLAMRERLATTEAKAKELRPRMEKLVTAAKSPTLAHRRHLERSLPSAAAAKLIKVIGPRMHERRGGYTRIIKLPPGRSDARSRALIEFVP